MEKFIGICLGLFLLLLVINAISAALAVLAWSYFAMPVFHAPALTFFQAWLATGALSILAALFRRSK